MILSSHVSDERIILFFSLLGNSIPNLVRLSGAPQARTKQSHSDFREALTDYQFQLRIADR